MALLELKGLTMRFGGLTAVNQVDLAVEQGRIASVIGPNGAGKTTVFNAITGIYEPTEGEVRFAGHDLRRPFTRALAVVLVLTGLMTGVVVALLSVNIDSLWRATIVLNYPDASEPFPLTEAWHDFWDYLSARVVAERERNRLTEIELVEKDGAFAIRSRGNGAVLETVADRAKGERRLQVLQTLVSLTGSVRTTVNGEGKWLVTNAAGEQRIYAGTAESRLLDGSQVAPAPAGWYVLGAGNVVLERFASRDEAKRSLVDLAVRAGKLRWRLVTRSSPESLGLVTSVEAAERDRGAVEELLAPGLAAPIEERDGAWVALSADRSRVLASFASADEARAQIDELHRIGRGRTRDRALVVLAFVVGAAFGGSGSYLVWKRGRRTPDVIAQAGLARTFQNIRLFAGMTVIENVLMGMSAHLKAGLISMVFKGRGARREEEGARSRALEILDFVGLKGRAGMLARSLPYGDQRRLEIARALATRPRLLLLDEPAAGMNPTETSELMALIRRIRDTGVTVLLIEHHMKVVMGISDHIAVLDYGCKIAEGTPAEVRANPKVIEAYLGKEELG